MRWRTKVEPMKPAPPQTRSLIRASFQLAQAKRTHPATALLSTVVVGDDEQLAEDVLGEHEQNDEHAHRPTPARPCAACGEDKRRAEWREQREQVAHMRVFGVPPGEYPVGGEPHHHDHARGDQRVYAGLSRVAAQHHAPESEPPYGQAEEDPRRQKRNVIHPARERRVPPTVEADEAVEPDLDRREDTGDVV